MRQHFACHGFGKRFIKDDEILRHKDKIPGMKFLSFNPQCVV